MGKQITITVSDEVASRLAEESDASAYVTTAVQRQIIRERKEALITTPRPEFTAEQLAEVREERLAAEQRMTPELRAWARAVIAEMAPHRLAQMPTA